MGRSEELGTGLRNVYKYSKAYSGSDNILFNEEDVFTVDVPLVNETKSNRNVVDNVVDNDLTIVRFLSENNTLSAKSIANKMDMTERTIQRYLKTLAEKGLIRRVGPANGGHWEITDQTRYSNQ